jgi:hypothetical protein
MRGLDESIASMGKIMGSWSPSDKLAIALFCSSGALALILFLVEKTPTAVRIIVVAIVALLLYPIKHFTSSRTAGWTALTVMVAAAGVFGWGVWPKPSSHVPVAVSPPNQPQSSITPNTDPKPPARQKQPPRVEKPTTAPGRTPPIPFCKNRWGRKSNQQRTMRY